MKLKLLILCTLMSVFSFSQVSILKDINPGNAGQATVLFQEYNGQLYFSARDDINSVELWKTDGTELGTELVEDFNPSNNPTVPQNFHVLPSSNELVFIGNNPNNSPSSQEWIRLNGNSLEIIADMSPFDDAVSGNGRSIVYTNTQGEDLLLFQGRSGTDNQRELHEYNPTTGNTNQLGDFNGTDSSSPQLFTNFQADNSVLFAMSDTGIGRELFKYDGNTITLVKDINTDPSTNNGSPSNFYEYNGEMYFSAGTGQNGVVNFELWKTDGTELGTVLVKDINPNNGSNNNSGVANFAEFGGLLYFTADDGNGRELWRTDGTTTGTIRIDVDPTTTSGSLANDLIATPDYLFFRANRTVTGTELFAVTPTGSVTLAANINPGTGNSNPDFFSFFNNKLYFNANDGTNGNELWVFDPSDFSTTLIDIVNGSGGSSPREGVVFNNRLYFQATTPATGSEIFVFNDAVLNTEDFDLNKNISLSPNPTTVSFQLKTNKIIDKVAIYDISGKLVKEYKREQEQYDISNLHKGVYFVKIKTDTQIQQTVKLIKQ